MDDPKTHLQEHSLAKVDLLRQYIRNYLSIVTNNDYVNRVRIFDLFCNRGVYDNDGEGSPIAILREVKELYFTRLKNKPKKPRIDCYFSDENAGHIKTLTDAVTNLRLHHASIGKFSCVSGKYQNTVKELTSERQPPASEKTFVFIDPYGYKDVRATEIQALLENRAEVLLFAPIQFMYRFESQGTPEALTNLLSELGAIDNWRPSANPIEFIIQLRDAYQLFLGKQRYVSTFYIEKDAHTLFCLFFFTTHIRGHEEMLKAKWKLDEDRGQGWSFRTVPDQSKLILDLDTLYLEEELHEFLRTGPRNNCDVYEFVLSREFLPRHANSVCKKFIANGRLKVENISSGPIKQGAFYIGYKYFKAGDKKIRFEAN